MSTWAGVRRSKYPSSVGCTTANPWSGKHSRGKRSNVQVYARWLALSVEYENNPENAS
jgi:hypothetical protein